MSLFGEAALEGSLRAFQPCGRVEGKGVRRMSVFPSLHRPPCRREGRPIRWATQAWHNPAPR